MKFNILPQIYNDFIDLAMKYDLDSTEVIEFILCFIIYNMRPDFDEEDARIFCSSVYQSMVKEINLRKG